MTLTLLEEAKRWTARAEENRTKAEAYRDWQCRATMRMLAEQAEAWAERAMTQAAAFDATLRIYRKIDQMQSKSGLHPYDDGLQCILRETSRLGPKSRAAIVARDVASVSNRSNVRMLAHMFNKTDRDVARDLINLFHALENGKFAG